MGSLEASEAIFLTAYLASSVVNLWQVTMIQESFLHSSVDTK